MAVRDTLRTSDLARGAGVSVQQVRNYEALGLLPVAERSTSGYRLYRARHLAALKTARGMVRGYGWQRVTDVMRALHDEDFSGALAKIDAHHAELAEMRLQTEQTLAALQASMGQSAPLPASRHAERLRGGMAAAEVGVRVSALHFWEQQGLLHPVRDKESRYRLYDEQQMRRLRLVVLLREAGYGSDAILPVLDELAAGNPQRAIRAVERRREELARASWACIEGLSLFRQYVEEFCGELLQAPAILV